MILWNTAWKSLKNNIVMNLFLMLQLAAAMIITAIMISLLCIRYTAYKPYEQYLNKNGFMIHYSGHAGKSMFVNSIDDYFEKESFRNQFPNADSVFSCYRLLVYFSSSESTEMISLDDELINSYRPNMKSGRWLEPSVYGDNCIEAVVTDNPYGWVSGDVIQMYSGTTPDKTPVNVKIVGILEDGARIPIGNRINSDTPNYNQIYNNYSYKVEQRPLILFSHSALQSAGGSIFQQFVGDLSFVLYPNDTDRSIIESDKEKASHFGFCTIYDLNECYENSKTYLVSQIMYYLPIVLILFLLIVSSTFSCTALSVRRRLYDYAVFSITGLPWKKCAYVNFIQSVMISFGSVCFSVIALQFLPYIKMQTAVTVIWNRYSIIGELLIIIIHLLIAMIIPWIVVHKHTPKEILTK